MFAFLTLPVEKAVPLKEQADDELMFAYKAGNTHAFAELVRRHEKPVYRFCMRSLGNVEHAADATQEVFLRIVKNATRWERKAKFTTWMYTIARNFCIDEARKKNFRKTDSLNETVGKDSDGGLEKIDRVADEGPGTERLIAGQRVREVVDRTLAALPEEQREVFCLRQYSGLSFKQIAEAVGAGENTVKSRMRYALNVLKKSLEDSGLALRDTS